MSFLQKKTTVKSSFGRFILTLLGLVSSIILYGFAAHFLGFDKGTFLQNISVFVVAFFALLFCIVKLHKQKLKDIFTYRKSMDWSRFFLAFFIWGGIALFQFIVSYFLSPQEYIFNFDFTSFLELLIVVLLIMPFQTSFEEVLFRGYLLQYVCWRGYRPITGIVITSVVFGLLHYANPEIDKMGNIALVYYILWGLFFSVLTVMDNGLELALGIHMVNNIFSVLLITADWTVFQTPSIFRFIGQPNLLLELLISIFFQIILLYYFSKKYQWAYFKKALFCDVRN